MYHTENACALIAELKATTKLSTPFTPNLGVPPPKSLCEQKKN